MTECPGCGGPLAGDEPICPACGTEIEQAPPAESGAEAVPSVEPEAGSEGRRCPACGTLGPAEAQFCVRCGHAFAGRAPFLGAGWLVVPAVIAVVLVVAAVAALSFGFVAIGPKAPAAANSSAHAGANDSAQQVLNQTRTAAPQAAPEVIAARNATATPTVTPTRTVDPDATPWNGADGAGIYHPEGGTHYVGVSREIRSHRATPTPLPYSGGDGSGHATGPLSWVGTGNWSPGFIDLPAGDAQVVLLSRGTTAFVLVDPAGNEVGFGSFLPPGGTYTLPVSQAGRYVIAFGSANATDSWSATVLLPGSSDGQAAAPPVATPATQLLSFAGSGGGPAGAFNLSPGTLNIQLSADQMTMAYLKDPWGVTLSTTVAGPNPGGSTVVIPREGRYSLEIWGTGTWSALLTWTATPGAAAPTVPTTVPTTVATTKSLPIVSLPAASATAPGADTKTAPVISIPTTAAAATTVATTAPPAPAPEYTLAITELDLANERVSIRNTGGAPVELQECTLSDAGPNYVYSFPPFVLGAGATVTVHTDYGTNSATELYWGQGAEIWNNTGDTATLKRPDDTVISTLTRP